MSNPYFFLSSFFLETLLHLFDSGRIRWKQNKLILTMRTFLIFFAKQTQIFSKRLTTFLTHKRHLQSALDRMITQFKMTFRTIKPAIATRRSKANLFQLAYAHFMIVFFSHMPKKRKRHIMILKGRLLYLNIEDMLAHAESF